MNSFERNLRRTLYDNDFYEFFKYFWDTYENVPFIDGPLVRFLCECFQYCCRKWIGYEEVELDMPLPEPTEDVDIIDIRGDYDRININIPPRHGKSDIFNRCGPTWLWTRVPVKVASVSHTQGLATDMNTDRHKIVNSKKFKEIYPEIVLDTNSKSIITDSSRGLDKDGNEKVHGGELYSINRNAFTGYGADIIINDDLTNAESARKDKEEMNNAWSYYKNTMPSRINNQNQFLIINIQQRLAPNDITGHILDDKKLRGLYKFIVLKAIFDKDTYLVCPISGKVFFFKKGSFLWQERFGDYEGLKISAGRDFEPQYMQNPMASDKVVINETMIREEDICNVPSIDQADIIYGSHDFPVKDKETSDYLGSILSYRVEGNLYILDCLEEHQSYTDSLKYVENLAEAFPGIIQIIEDKANGSPIIQQLQNLVPGIVPFQPGTQSKVQRAESATWYMNTGNVIFVRDVYDKFTNTYTLSEHLENLKKRLIQFPLVQHDDIVDAFTMNVLYCFLDRKNAVYGRSFNNKFNIVKESEHKATNDYYVVFFNKEGDNWKALDIGVIYSEETKLIVRRETFFKASIDEGIEKLNEFAGPNRPKVYIDTSSTDALYGQFGTVDIEHYLPSDFEKSVSNLNIAFAKRRVLIDEHCKLTKGDIDNFKFAPSKDENVVKFRTEKDGFVSCIRGAIYYFGGINN